MLAVMRNSISRISKCNFKINKFQKKTVYSNAYQMSNPVLSSSKKQVGIWLAAMSGMTVGAVVLGGITRLTESGLSMTDWHLVKERPPFSDMEWIAEFEKYKQFPEYKHIISERGSMSLSEFKFIWWMEYSHRMWGRAIGVAYAIPAAYFYYKGYFSRSMKVRVLLLGGLIGFQGLLGWYMVQSGLKSKPQNDRSVPRVSQYRLAAHLGSALALYSIFLWNAFTHLSTPVQLIEFPQMKMLRGMTHGVKLLVVLTALSGAFVAGLDAGLTYNSWPKMADRWVPTDLLALSPTWINVFQNPTTAQFDHRWLGQATGVLVFALWLATVRHRASLPPRVRMAAHFLACAVLAQISLGISTLLHYVPTTLAASHQAGSLMVLSCALWLSHSLRRLPK